MFFFYLSMLNLNLNNKINLQNLHILIKLANKFINKKKYLFF